MVSLIYLYILKEDLADFDEKVKRTCEKIKAGDEPSESKF